MTRFDIVRRAREYQRAHTPFVHQGSRIGVGCDCIGLVGAVARDHGTLEGLAWSMDLSIQAYPRVPHPETLLAGVAKYLDRISAAEATIGDILLVAILKDPQHFVIISQEDPTYVIHASSSVGRVVENRLDDRWRSRVKRAYRYRGLVE